MKIFGVIILGFSSLFMSCDSVNYDDLESLKAKRNQVLSDKKEIKSNYEALIQENQAMLNTLDSTINVHPANEFTKREIKKVPVTVIEVEQKTFEHFLKSMETLKQLRMQQYIQRFPVE